MAKIQFGDYLKSKKKKENIYESSEALLARAKKKLEVDPIVVSPAYRVQNLEEASRLFQEAKDCPGAGRLYEETQTLLKDARQKRDQARNKARSLNRRFQVKRILVIIVIAAVILLLLWAYRNGLLNYSAARLEGLGGKYESAYGRLSKIDVLDSKKQAEKYYQLYLRNGWF